MTVLGFAMGHGMAKFLAVGYGDEAGYQRTKASLRQAAHEQDARLKDGGVLMGIAGKPVQVRNHEDAEVQVIPGSFMRSDLPVAGFSLIEADDLQAAIEMVSKTPCAVAHGVVEVWPLLEAR
jgi:hypothetical protein